MNMSNRTLLKAATVVAVMSIPSASWAAVISMDSFTGAWSNQTGSPSNFNTTNNGGNDPQAHWGIQATGNGQSGYTLDMAPPPPTPIVQNVPPNTPAFLIGTFTHVNQPITGNSITGIDLRVTFDVVVDAIDQGLKNFDFHFAHTETPNGDNPCAFGGANGQGVNSNGCADRVVVSFIDTSDTFLVNGVLYTFDLLGFSTDGGTTITNSFLTTENANNPAGLFATIRASTISAPEPGTLALLGVGLAGLGFLLMMRPGPGVMRRRRAA